MSHGKQNVMVLIAVAHLQAHNLGTVYKRANRGNRVAFHNQLSRPNNTPEMVCFEPSTVTSSNHFDMSVEPFPHSMCWLPKMQLATIRMGLGQHRAPSQRYDSVIQVVAWQNIGHFPIYLIWPSPNLHTG